MPEVFRRALLDRARTLGAWAIGTVLYIAMITAVFPSIKSSPGFDQLTKQYPEVLKHLFGMTGSINITTGPGYLDTELFSAMLPLFVLALAIGTGAGTLAGEHEQGLLEMVVSRPLSRRSVVLWKAAAMAVEVLAITTVMAASIAVADPIVGLSLDLTNLVTAAAGLAGLGLVYGSLSLAVGAGTRHRASAIGVPAAAGAIAYLIAGLSGLATWLEPFRFVSPFHYAGRAPLQSGVDLSGLIILIATSAILTAAAVVVFQRRDIT